MIPRRGSYFRPDRAGWQHHIYYAPTQLARMSNAAGLAQVCAGKAILRRRLCVGPRTLWEYLRYSAVWLGSKIAGLSHVRREIQLIAQRQEGATGMQPSRRYTA